MKWYTRRSQVYNAVFYVDHGVVERHTEDRAISLAQLGEELEHLDGPIFLVGDGADLTHKTLHETVEELILPPEHRKHQRAVGVGLIAARMAENGEAPSGGALTPNYLRLSQAEREKLERQQKK